MTTNHAHINAGKPERNEWKVLLILLLSFLFMETLVRCYAGSISLDLRNTLATHQTATRISRALDETKTVLVVGNSLARCGVDLALLTQENAWPQDVNGQGIEAELFAPDASSIAQWDWGMRRYFANTGSHPDVILLFTARTSLIDSPTSPETLGAYYIGNSDLGDALKSMHSGEDAIRLLLGVASHLLANRDRVRTRIGYSYLPGFEIAWPALTTLTKPEGESYGRKQQNIGTKSLERFIATARQMGADLRVFSVPMPEPYSLPDPVLRLLEKSKVPYHNLSKVPGIDSSHFPDGYHLDKAGARTFTKALILTLNP